VTRKYDAPEPEPETAAEIQERIDELKLHLSGGSLNGALNAHIKILEKKMGDLK
jgi:hypothetical protein